MTQGMKGRIKDREIKQMNKEQSKSELRTVFLATCNMHLKSNIKE